MMFKQDPVLSLITLVAVATLVSRHVAGCPSYCECGSYTVTCNSVPATSLKDLSQDIPLSTSVLEIRGGLFYSITGADFDLLRATQLTELKITDGQLRDIQNAAFIKMPSLRVLMLNNNQISSIQSSAFRGLKQLQTIDLSNNRLGSIPDSFFTDQTNLRSLSIAGNKNINNLRGASFQGLRNLRTFLATGCSIRTFENDFFPSISTVDTLDLSHNDVQSLPNSANFKQMSSLRNLTLQGNKLTSLIDSQFAEMDLDVLDLSSNMIGTVTPNAFMYLRVRNLDLSNNALQTLPEYLFQPISSELYSLKLNHNRQLTTLPSNIFDGMTKMQVLNISNCALETLHNELFQQIFVLRDIDLSNNRLKYVSQSLLDRSNYLQTIGLTNNPWHCDCKIKPFQSWLQVPYSSSKLYCGPYNRAGFNMNCPKPKCSTPVSLMFREIATLMEDDLGECENVGESRGSMSINIIAGIIAGALLVIVIIVVIIACCVYQRKKRGQALPCYDPDEQLSKNKKREKTKAKEIKAKAKKSKEKRNKGGYYEEKKERRNIDPEVGSLNESDKSFVVRNYFHSMNPDPDAASDGTQSMTRKGSQESLSQSGYGYGSRHGSRHSSQYSLNAGYKIESAV
ncbi:hypothetical protein ACF0H5_006182 [Mactra antiquata]